MAWPGTLTTEEQGVTKAFDTELRGAILQLVEAVNRCQDVYDWYWRQIGGGDNLISKLDNADVVPNTTSYAGSLPMSKTEITTSQMAYVESVVGINTAAHRDHYRIAIGGPNMSRRG